MHYSIGILIYLNTYPSSDLKNSYVDHDNAHAGIVVNILGVTPLINPDAPSLIIIFFTVSRILQ